MPRKESPSYPQRHNICKFTAKHPIFTNACLTTCSKSDLASIHSIFCLLSVNIQENSD